MGNKETADKLIGKALNDSSFKETLKKEPAQAIQKATGVVVPAGITVKVLEDTATLVHLVLPAPMPKVSGELDEKQLESVSGGTGRQTLGCGDSTARCVC